MTVALRITHTPRAPTLRIRSAGRSISLALANAYAYF